MPTSLNVIPTADVLEHGTANIGIQLAGGPTSSDYLFLNEFQTEFGAGDGIEFGYDQALPPEGPSFWNAKYQIYAQTRRRPAIAVGALTGLGQLQNPFYITSYKSLGDARFHAGAIQIGDSWRAMFGWDLWHYSSFSLQADYISGPLTYASFGFVRNWPGGWSLNAAQLFGNSVDAPNMHLFMFAWTGEVW